LVAPPIGQNSRAGLMLRLKRGQILATVIPDPDWPKMYRAQMPNRPLSDD
jgi:hypothetical protein